jgi:hypothetical protein
MIENDLYMYVCCYYVAFGGYKYGNQLSCRKKPTTCLSKLRILDSWLDVAHPITSFSVAVHLHSIVLLISYTNDAPSLSRRSPDLLPLRSAIDGRERSSRIIMASTSYTNIQLWPYASSHSTTIPDPVHGRV